ncbi:polycystin-2-like protein 2 [Amphiura filiformis]|uniref:polycystin-2-like protein 2 n=1 Tax=Amphiura filiformis TaxID=82378 RepID=UPI003B212251
MQDFGHVFTSHTASKLNDGHLWFSIFNRPPSTRFTRVQRVLCAMMILWLEMLVNIMWYEVRPPPEAGRKLNIGPFSLSPAQISIGVQANLIVFPVSFLVVQLFRKARARHKRKSRIELAKQHQQTVPEENSTHVDVSHASIRSPSRVIVTHDDNDGNISDQQQLLVSPPSTGCYVRWWAIYIAWIIAVVAILSATVITVFYGIQFGNETTKKWFTSVTVAFCTGVFITQPLQAIAIGLFVALIIKTPNADEDGEMKEDEEEYKLKTDEEWLHSYAESKSLRKPSACGPPDPQLIENQRIQRIKELQMHSIIREILVYFIFLFIVLLIAYSSQNTQAFYIKTTHTNLLVYDEVKVKGVHRAFIDAKTVDKYWTWLEDMLLPQLHGGVWYNGDIDDQLLPYTADKVSYMLGYAIIRQLRVKKDQCTPISQMKNVTPNCYVAYSWDNEDRQSYGPGWTNVNETDNTPDEYTYKGSNDLDGYPFIGRHAVYRGGGYTVKLSGTPLENRAILERLQKEAWLDHYTRAVFVQFGSYNAFVNLFSSVTLLMEFLPTGGGYPFHRVDVIKLINYTNDGLFIFRVACEITFFLFIIFFFFKEINNLRIEKKKYFKRFWNYIEIIIIFFSVGSITAYFFRYVETVGLLSNFDAYDGTVFINLQYATYLNDIFHYMFGGVAFFSILKFLKLLRFNKRMHMLTDTIHNIRWDLFYFAIFFSFVFFAFSLAFYMAFSSHLLDFADIVYTMETLLQVLLRRFYFADLLLAKRVLGPLFLFRVYEHNELHSH